MPEALVAIADETLRELPTAHTVWEATSSWLRHWQAARVNLTCMRAGECNFCGQHFEVGGAHWCLVRRSLLSVGKAPKFICKITERD